MGFMDKAKKLAEQAQQKLDEAQNQLNSSQPQHQGGSSVTYDEHGRPVQDAPPAAATPPAPVQPVAATPPAPEAPAPPVAAGDAPNATPDPFKPLQ